MLGSGVLFDGVNWGSFRASIEDKLKNVTLGEIYGLALAPVQSHQNDSRSSGSFADLPLVRRAEYHEDAPSDFVLSETEQASRLVATLQPCLGPLDRAAAAPSSFLS